MRSSCRHHPSTPVAYLAAAKLGAITAGVNDRLTTAERNALLETAAPRLVLAAPGLEPDGVSNVETVTPADGPDAMLHELRATDETPPALADEPDRPVAIVFTSGTTGLPKGALYCNRQLAFITADGCRGHVGRRRPGRGRYTDGAPRVHDEAARQPAARRHELRHAALARRGRAAARRRPSDDDPRRRPDPAGVDAPRARLRRLRPRQRALPRRRRRTDHSRPGREARDRFRAALATRYSCTEAGIGLGTAFDDPEEDAIVSVGRPHPAIELGVLDDDDRPVPTGDIGQVCLRSPAVMSGYWRNTDATRAAFTADGFIRTGDLGWVDDRGRLRLVGRTKEMYVRGGYNVFPVEVEAVLSTHPAVAGVAITPVADPVMGEIGVAVIVPRDAAAPPSLAQLREFATPHLAPYKLPEALRVVESLPLTPMEKVDRRALREVVTDSGQPIR